MARIVFHNSTDLPNERLLALCQEGIHGWATGTITLRVRYSRSTPFSGTCYYADRRIFVNLGRQLTYPYRMATHLARAKTRGRTWSKPLYTVDLRDGCDVVIFIFMHELFHLLVKRAGRNTRQKESMCDRFAARFLVDRLGSTVRTPAGKLVPREEWDFQDLHRFVAAARDQRVILSPSPPSVSAPMPIAACNAPRERQLTLFAP